MGVSEATLRGIDDVIALAAGESKRAAVQSVLKSRMVSSLVIDARTAAGLVS
ncbi:hypothetical protein KUG88_27015 [Rhodococcus rhodochrous]|uniref:sugar-binding domain-containing protein n=1 Tax=Rhodococcus rhodochrous TaxID=1829 RepID=UPI001E635945|nr:sugar-binding domain-containing protein [Rhodococcus rhodochrous]MCB8913768.1 hypothetical protein [Rhodococcus rhodochrous]